MHLLHEHLAASNGQMALAAQRPSGLLPSQWQPPIALCSSGVPAAWPEGPWPCHQSPSECTATGRDGGRRAFWEAACCIMSDMRCGAATVLWCRAAGLQELRDAVCCSAVQCAGESLGDGQLESLSHVFLQCPVVQPAVAWLRALWGRVVEGRVLPVNARVLLAGHHTVWDPGGGETGAELWTHFKCKLRLLFCRAVWHLRCCRAAEGQVFTAATVVALESWVQRAIRLDWLRVTSDLAGESASLPTWCSKL
jgi:hypothetical protein